MSEEERDDAKPADQVRVTTQENALVEKPAGAWQMPEPVYRNSSGYLPQGFEKQFPQPAAAEPGTSPAAAPSAAPQAAAAAAPAADVEPQPDLIEILAAEPPVAPVIARPGRSPLSIVLIIIGLIVMAAVVLGFLVVVYYLFLAAPAETSF